MNIQARLLNCWLMGPLEWSAARVLPDKSILRLMFWLGAVWVGIWAARFIALTLTIAMLKLRSGAGSAKARTRLSPTPEIWPPVMCLSIVGSTRRWIGWWRLAMLSQPN